MQTPPRIARFGYGIGTPRSGISTFPEKRLPMTCYHGTVVVEDQFRNA